MLTSARRFSLYDETPETWEEALSGHLMERRAAGAAPRTIQGVDERVRAFFRMYPDAWGGACKIRLLEHIGQEGIAPATANFRLKALVPFFRYCTEKGVFDRSPAEGLKQRRAEPRIVEHSPEEIDRMITVMDTSSFCGMRDMALFTFSIDTGARPTEALLLLPGDIDFTDNRAFIRAETAKTRKSRSVAFCKNTAKALKALLKLRPKEWGACVPLFCTRSGEMWSSHSWTVQLKRYAKKAGVPRFSAYDLRHYHAINFLRSGGNIMLLSREMGHSDLETTKGYLNFTFEDLKKEHAKASPVLALIASRKRAAG